ncbi:MAG: P22 phage major capsid protein family protein, partial [Armatimonadia bacterium]
FTNGVVADLSGGVQDTTFGSEQYRLRNVVGASMGWADFVKIKDLGDARESEAIKAAALRLAHDIDAYIMRFAALASNNLLGDGVSPVATWDDVVAGYTRLKEEGCEDDMNLRAVLTYADKQALGKDIVESVTAKDNLASLGGAVYREGWQGKIAGIPTNFTQQLPSFTVGTRLQTSALTAGTADSAGSYEDYCISPAPGQFLTQILNMDIGSGAETVLDGEVFTIAGVFAYDNRAKKALGHLQQFRVVGNATASGGLAAVRVYPAIITSGPYKTVAQAPANTAAVNFVGAPGAVLQPRFLANKDAIIVHTADLITPATGISMRKALTKLPMSVRMWQDSKFETGEHRVRFDVAIEPNVAANGRRKIVRINGG